MANTLPKGFEIQTPKTAPRPADLPEGFEILTSPNQARPNFWAPPPISRGGGRTNPDIAVGAKRGLQNIPGLVLGMPNTIGQLGQTAEGLVKRGVEKAASVYSGKPVNLPNPPSYIPSPFDVLTRLPSPGQITGALEYNYGAAPYPETAQGRFSQHAVELLPTVVGPRKVQKGLEVAEKSIGTRIGEALSSVPSRAASAIIPAAALTGVESAPDFPGKSAAEIAALVAAGSLTSPGKSASVFNKGGVKTSALQEATDAAFTKLRTSGIEYNPSAFDGLVSGIERKFGRGPNGMFINPTRHAGSYSLLQDLKAMKGSNVDWNDLHNIRMEANDIANTYKPELSADRKFAREIIKQIDEFNSLPKDRLLVNPNNIPEKTVSELTSSAFDLNKRLAKTKAIESAVADAMSGGADNAKAAAQLRQNMKRLASRIATGKSRGWTKDEIAAIDSVAKGNYESGAMNTLSKLGFDASLFGVAKLGTAAGISAVPFLTEAGGYAIPATVAAITAPATVARAFGPRAALSRGQQLRDIVSYGPEGQAAAQRVATANKLRQTYGGMLVPGILDEERR